MKKANENLSESNLKTDFRVTVTLQYYGTDTMDVLFNIVKTNWESQCLPKDKLEQIIEWVIVTFEYRESDAMHVIFI